MNRKETPKASFEKYTGHMFLKQLRIHKENLSEFEIEQDDRNYLFLAKRSISSTNQRQADGRRQVRLYALQSPSAALATI